MAGTGERIADFIAATADLRTEAAFLAAFPFPFLVREATAGGVAGAEAPSGDRSTIRVAKKAAVPTGGGFAEGDVTIYRVCPADLERNDGAVTLGRAPGCDVVVDHPTISERHASFTLEVRAPDPDDEDDDGRTFFITDEGSSNGTFVDGVALEAGRPARVDDQTSVRFGPAVKMQFFTPRGFHQFLEYFRRMKSKKKKASP